MSKFLLRMLLPSFHVALLATVGLGQEVAETPDNCDGMADEQERGPHLDFLQVSQRLGNKLIKTSEAQADCDLSGSYSVALPDVAVPDASGRNGSVVLLEVSGLRGYITGEWPSEGRPNFTGVVSSDCKTGYVVFPDGGKQSFSCGSGTIQMLSGVSWRRTKTARAPHATTEVDRKAADSSTATVVSYSQASECDMGGSYRVSADFLSLDGLQGYDGSTVTVDMSERELTGRWTNSARPKFSGMISADCTLGYMIFPDNTIQKFSYAAGSGALSWFSGGRWTRG